MNLTLPIEVKSQAELRAIFDKMKPANNAVPIEYVEDGVKKTAVLDMAEGLQKSLEFWSGLVLPDIPEVFVSNGESDTSPRGKL